MVILWLALSWLSTYTDHLICSHIAALSCQGLTAKEVCDFFFKEDTRLEWEGECVLPL